MDSQDISCIGSSFLSAIQHNSKTWRIGAFRRYKLHRGLFETMPFVGKMRNSLHEHGCFVVSLVPYGLLRMRRPYLYQFRMVGRIVPGMRRFGRDFAKQSHQIQWRRVVIFVSYQRHRLCMRFIPKDVEIFHLTFKTLVHIFIPLQVRFSFCT